MFCTVLGAWGLVLQAPGCIPAVWISLSLDLSSFGRACTGYGIGTSPLPFWALEGPLQVPVAFPQLCSAHVSLLFIEGGYLLFDILLLSGGVPGFPPGTSSLAYHRGASAYPFWRATMLDEAFLKLTLAATALELPLPLHLGRGQRLCPNGCTFAPVVVSRF